MLNFSAAFLQNLLHLLRRGNCRTADRDNNIPFINPDFARLNRKFPQLQHFFVRRVTGISEFDYRAKS